MLTRLFESSFNWYNGNTDQGSTDRTIAKHASNLLTSKPSTKNLINIRR